MEEPETTSLKLLRKSSTVPAFHGTARSTSLLPKNGTSICMSLCKFDFHITLENSFVVVFVLAPYSASRDDERMASSRTIRLFVIVSMAALQGHRAGT